MHISDKELGPCKEGGIISKNGSGIIFIQGLLVQSDNKRELCIFLLQGLLTSLVQSLIDYI